MRTKPWLVVLVVASACAAPVRRPDVRPYSLTRDLATAFKACPEPARVQHTAASEYQVAACQEIATYSCRSDNSVCTLQTVDDLVTSRAAPATQAAAPGSSRPFAPPPQPTLVPPGSYNPNTGVVQHSYTWQYSSPPAPSPPIHH